MSNRSLITSIYILCAQILSIVCISNLNLKFYKYEELTPENFTVRIRRDSLSGQVRMKIVSFSALKRTFVLSLKPGSPVLHEKTEGFAVDGSGRFTPFGINHNDFYTGFLDGDPEQGVDAAHVDGLWLAQIYTRDDIYAIEPLTLYDSSASPRSMLMFGHRDMRNQVTMSRPFCEEVIVPTGREPWLNGNLNGDEKISGKSRKQKELFSGDKKHFDTNFANENVFDKSHISHFVGPKQDFLRNRRLRSANFENSSHFSVNYDTCDILAVVDYETYKGIGHNNTARVISIFTHIYQAVDRLFRSTHFGQYSNMGIMVSKFFVHSNYTATEGKHYNMKNNVMSGIQSLYSLMTVPHFSGYCLTHVSTQRNFRGTLGLATTAEVRGAGWNNGICARWQDQSTNVGITTVLNARGGFLPMLTYTLVVAHEVGHNWGSHHDPIEKQECTPAPDKGGKFLMWEYSGQTDSVNSKLFSSCSQKEIETVLQSKAHLCFVSKSNTREYCGNGVLDPAEDCDLGHQVDNNDDVCCTSNCRFQPGAVCSPRNYPCCTESCQIAPSTQKCYTDNSMDCYELPFCSGLDFKVCPQPKAIPDNSSCGDHGECWHGNCIAFCQLLGQRSNPTRRLQACTSEIDRTSMCRLSCLDGENGGACTVMGGPHKEGTPCLYGCCKDGECTEPEEKEDLSEFTNKSCTLRIYSLVFKIASFCIAIFILRLACN